MNKNNSQNIFKFVFIIIVLILLVELLYFNKMPYYLEFYPKNSDKPSFQLRVFPGDKFTISYTHSFNKTPVSETFLINKDGNIILKETEYSWQAVGLQDTYPIRGIWGYKNGNICISEINDKLECIPLRVGTIANHKLIFKGEMIPFLSFAKGGELVNIKICRHW